MGLQECYTMDEMAEVIKRWSEFKPTALVITYGDIWRTDATIEGVQLLRQWQGRLKADMKSLRIFADKNGYKGGKLIALRYLYLSRFQQMRDCEVRIAHIHREIEANRSIAEKVEAWEMAWQQDTESPVVELPF